MFPITIERDFWIFQHKCAIFCEGTWHSVRHSPIGKIKMSPQSWLLIIRSFGIFHLNIFCPARVIEYFFFLSCEMLLCSIKLMECQMLAVHIQLDHFTSKSFTYLRFKWAVWRAHFNGKQRKQNFTWKQKTHYWTWKIQRKKRSHVEGKMLLALNFSPNNFIQWFIEVIHGTCFKANQNISSEHITEVNPWQQTLEKIHQTPQGKT